MLYLLSYVSRYVRFQVIPIVKIPITKEAQEVNFLKMGSDVLVDILWWEPTVTYVALVVLSVAGLWLLVKNDGLPFAVVPFVSNVFPEDKGSVDGSVPFWYPAQSFCSWGKTLMCDR